MIKIPRKDKTGPEGKGPRTGRGLGPCSIKKTLVEPEEVFEETLRRGFGRRRRFW